MAIDDIVRQFNAEETNSRGYIEGALHMLRQGLIEAEETLFDRATGLIDRSKLTDSKARQKYGVPIAKAVAKATALYSKREKGASVDPFWEDAFATTVFGISATGIQNMIEEAQDKASFDGLYATISQQTQKALGNVAQQRKLSHLKDDDDFKEKLWKYVGEPEFIKPKKLDMQGMGLLLDLHRQYGIVEAARIQELYEKQNAQIPAWFKSHYRG